MTWLSPPTVAARPAPGGSLRCPLFATADPDALLWTTAFAKEALVASVPLLLDNEFAARPDVNRFVDSPTLGTKSPVSTRRPRGAIRQPTVVRDRWLPSARATKCEPCSEWTGPLGDLHAFTASAPPVSYRRRRRRCNGSRPRRCTHPPGRRQRFSSRDASGSRLGTPAQAVILVAGDAVAGLAGAASWSRTRAGTIVLDRSKPSTGLPSPAD